MSFAKFTLAAAFACAALPAFADAPFSETDMAPPATETSALQDASATRIDDAQVQLKFTFDGGACQEIETPTLSETVDGVQSITIPTRNTAEMCTMQIVQIPVDVTLDVPAEVTALDVTVLGTNGETQLEGPVEID